MRTQNIYKQREYSQSGFLTLIGDNTRKTFELGEFSIIGRCPTAQISLADEFLSTRHARIEKRNEGFYIRDLRSRNGTYLNGTRILEAKLQDNDRLKIGITEFIFSSEAASENQTSLFESKNPVWQKQLQKLPAMAQTHHPILIIGPTGTGKELLANAIHRLSPRSNAPFLSVNCSALTENLAESELFGHKKGSYTGAQEDRKGAFESARGGTLFLDEIGDMPINIQPKFLRALENSEIKPVGSDLTHTTDVRIVAATNKDLRSLVARGLFREDLYYRLHILQLHPPALIERIEDLPLLLLHLAKSAKIQFSPQAIEKLMRYSWPGNIRELKNLISRASALFSGQMIHAPDLVQLIDYKPSTSTVTAGTEVTRAKDIIKSLEKETIISRLRFHRGNQRRVATDLHIPKSTLNDHIQKFQIDAKEFKPIKGKSQTS